MLQCRYAWGNNELLGGGFFSENLHNYRWILWPGVGGYASLFPYPPSEGGARILNTDESPVPL